MTIYKSNARLKRESNDRVVASYFLELKKQFPKESNTTLMMTVAQQKSSPYTSLAGVRLSLKRSKTI